MTSMPEVLGDSFEVDDVVLEVARAWRAEFQKEPTPIDVVVTTNANYADLLVRQFPGALAATKKEGRVEVGSRSRVLGQPFVSCSRRPNE